MIRFFLMSLVLLSGVGVCLAQPGGVMPTAYESLDVGPATQQVQFERRGAQAGDRVDQTLSVGLTLDSTIRRGTETIDQSKSAMQNVQQRTIIAGEVVAGRTVEAQVRFLEANRTITDSGNQDGAEQIEQQPTVGNTYTCRRLEDDSLQVTRSDGSFPTPEEHRLVSESMAALGRANPLAEFLAGKTITVGEKLELPAELGAGLLGSSAAMGNVSRFELTLKEVADEAGVRVAKFDAELEAEGEQKTQMRLLVAGTLKVEVDTCRTRHLKLSGPLGMATTMGSYSQAETTFVRGKLNLEMNADYVN